MIILVSSCHKGIAMKKSNMILKNFSVENDTSKKPGSFYVQGYTKGGTFFPEGVVQGAGDLQIDGDLPGWFEFGSAEFYPDYMAKAPAAPYIRGFMTKNGFVPSEREIQKF